MENREIVITVSKEADKEIIRLTDMGSRVVDNGLRQNICLHNGSCSVHRGELLAKISTSPMNFPFPLLKLCHVRHWVIIMANDNLCKSSNFHTYIKHTYRLQDFST